MKSTNGCGPEGTPDDMKNRFFAEQCNKHDLNYESDLPREIADQEFFDDMLHKANKNVWRVLQAVVMYLAVRSFGYFFYGKAK